MIEGKIADEDFKGDPAWNVPGQKGIRGRAKKADGEDEEDEEEVCSSARFVLLSNS